MGIEELSPIERIEFLNVQVERRLLEFVRMKEGIAIVDPEFRMRYFECAMSVCTLMWEAKLKKNDDEDRVMELEAQWEKNQAGVLEGLDIGEEVQAQLFDMANFFARTIVKTYYGILQHFVDMQKEDSDRLSPVFVIYMKANAKEHPDDFRSVACTMMEYFSKG